MTAEFKSTFEEICRVNNLQNDFVLLCDNSDFENCNLSLNGIHISIETINAVLEALEKSDDILELDLSRCRLDQEELIVMAKGLKREHIAIRTLKLDEIRIDRILLVHLSLFIKENHSVRRLSLPWCRIGEDVESATAFFTAVGQNDTIEHLDISNNAIASSLGKALAKTGLRHNLSLRILDLSWNKIGESGGQSLAQVLKINKTLQKIHLAGNDVSTSTLLAIDSQLSHNVAMHMKHAEMISKTHHIATDLHTTREKLHEELSFLKNDYEDLEYKSMQQKESMLFQMGQIEEQLKLRNKDLGALTEKHSLTMKALEVAEEKIAFLEMVDKRRDKYLKDLQLMCADHEKAQREESFKREAELELMVQNAVKEANEAKLEAVKAQEELHVSKTHNEDLKQMIEGMKKEKAVLIETHDKVIDQLTKRHQGIEEDMTSRRREAKEDYRRTIEEMEQRHADTIRELAEEKSRLREKIEEIRLEVKTIKSDHSDEKTRMLEKHKGDLKQLREENQKSREIYEAKIVALRGEITDIESKAKEVKKMRDNTELELEKSQLLAKNLQKKVHDHEGERDHIRELVKVDLEEEINEGRKCKENLEIAQNKCTDLESELKSIKDTYCKEKQDLSLKITDLENNLKEQTELLEHFKRDEKKRAQGLMEAVKLFVSSDNNCNKTDAVTG